LLPVNSDFVPAENGVEIFVFSGEFHSDIIVPIRTEAHDWRNDFPPDHFPADTSLSTHVAIGWGERNFYLHTPTWSDLKFSTACKALLTPSEAVMHASMVYKPAVGSNIRSVCVSNDQYLKMVRVMQQSFVRGPDRSIKKIQGYAYSNNDAFEPAIAGWAKSCKLAASKSVGSLHFRRPYLFICRNKTEIHISERTRGVQG
jgi:uncharacterized protein (TIGR02117 family)